MCVTSQSERPTPGTEDPTAREGAQTPRPKQRGHSIAVRDATYDDIPALAAIHAECLPQDFLVRLGVRFLRKALFPTLLASPRARIYVAEEPGRVLGLFVTRVGLGGIVAEILWHRPLWFLATCAHALARHPSLLRECVSIVRQLRWRGSQPDDPTVADMFLLAVVPWVRRRGIGRALIEHSLAQLQASGVTSCRAIPHAENAASNAIFRSIGFAERRVYRFGNRLWCENEMKLAPIIQT